MSAASLCWAVKGNLSYTVQRDEKSVLDFGAMGMKTEIGDFSEGLEFVSVSDATTVDETYSVNSIRRPSTATTIQSARLPL